jgi:serine/threonine protein kinase/tetratricopeptide (TPR) repeat protein
MAPKQNPEEIFNKAVEITDPKEQAAFLEETCGGDEKLRAEVDALLNWNQEAGSFLNVPDGNDAATLETSAVPDASGTVIGRYKLLEKIGEGGMATVYMAEQKRPIRRRVALKVIKLGMDTKQVIGRFEAERQALAMMDHPNIAKVLDAGTTETGRPYFVMELVKGLPITEFCDSNHLTTEERLDLFTSVCQAVHHAHQKGIIHRDIKPTNVLVTLHDGRPVVKVIDFGIAKAVNQQLTEKTVFTRFSQMIGTPEYMSPEQAEMSGLDIDTRTDVFSLGVLLYELLTGTTPFDSEYLLSKGYNEMQRIIREEEPMRPSTKVSTLGDTLSDVAKYRRTKPEALSKLIRSDLDWIVMKTLEKDRQRRYESVGELAAEVRRHLNHEPVLAGRPSPVYRLKKLMIRNRTKVFAGSAIIALAVAVALVFAMYVRSAKRVRATESLEHEALLSKAQEFRSNGQFQEAMAQVETIVDSEHVGSEAQLLHARLVMELEGPSGVFEELRQLLNEPDEIACQAHFLLARAYLESDSGDSGIAQQYQQQAREHQDKGERLFFESAEAYFNRAILTGTVSKTLEYLNKALDLDPSHYASRKARALAYYAIGDLRNMERDAVRMTTLRHWDALGYSLIAIALREARDYMEAIRYHDRAIEKSPNQPGLYEERCRTYMRMESYQEALSDARTCLRFNPEEGMYHFRYFCALVALGRYDEARATYDWVMESGLMNSQRFALRSSKHVSDMLDTGLSWRPRGPGPKGCQAFAEMQDWDELTRQLSKKARRLVEGFHPTWSPDGKELAYCRGHWQDRTGIEIMNLNTEKTRLLTVSGFDPAWSPDGRYIVFVRGPQTRLLTDLTAGRETPGVARHELELWLIKANSTEEPRFLAKGGWPSWSSDSKEIFFQSAVDDTLCMIDIDRKARPRSILASTDEFPTVSPDGMYVAYPYPSKNGPSRIVDLSTNTTIANLDMPPVAGGGRVSWSSEPDNREFCITGDGLWIYELDTKTASKVLNGRFGTSSWSPSHAHQFAINAHAPGGHEEIWVATLDPSLSTTESLGPGRTFEEHCSDEVDRSSHLINIHPQDMKQYIWRATCYILRREYDKAAADFNEAATRFLKAKNRYEIDWSWFERNMPDFGRWGIEMYEAGEYRQAHAMLSGIDKLRRAARVDPNVAELACIAMSLHQLGRESDGESALDELRKELQNDYSRDSVKWLCKVEQLFAPDQDTVRQAWELIGLGRLSDARQIVEELQSLPREQAAEISGGIARVTRVLSTEYYARGKEASDKAAAYAEAISDYRAALSVDPNHTKVLSGLAWSLVTCPETDLRDEKMAVENAIKACESMGWTDHRGIGVLAAVYAQVGDFDNATRWQRKALDLITSGNAARWRAVHESRLGLYQSGKTFHGASPWDRTAGGMVGHWKFDEMEGTIAKDSSSSGSIGNLVGEPKWAAGRASGAIELDGNRDYVEVQGIDMVTDHATFVAWINGWKANDWAGIVMYRFGPRNTPVCGMGFGDDDKLHYHWNNGDLRTWSWTGGPTIPQNEWAMVALVIEPSRATAYVYSDIKGLQKGVNEIVHIPQQIEQLTIGRDHVPVDYPNRFFRGSIDDVRVYDNALTEAEIKALCIKSASEK